MAVECRKGLALMLYLDENKHTGDEDEGHVEGQQLEQRKGQAASLTALLHSLDKRVKAGQSKGTPSGPGQARVT